MKFMVFNLIYTHTREREERTPGRGWGASDPGGGYFINSFFLMLLLIWQRHLFGNALCHQALRHVSVRAIPVRLGIIRSLS